jgi:Uma2 family endonuclease
LRLGGRLERYLEETGEGMAVTEVRHLNRDEERVYLPDINVWTGEVPNLREALEGGPQERTPDIAIEVLSPGDSAGRTLQRAAFYMRTGVPLAWFVDPDTESVTVYRQGEEPSVHRAPDILDARPVLRDFRIDLSVLFAVPDNR